MIAKRLLPMLFADILGIASAGIVASPATAQTVMCNVRPDQTITCIGRPDQTVACIVRPDQTVEALS